MTVGQASEHSPKILRSCRRSVAIASAVLLTLAACGNETTTSSTGAGTSSEELAASLVTAEDLGDGWSVTPDPETGETSGVVSEEVRDKLPRIQLCEKASAEAVAAAKALRWEAFRQLNLATETESSQPATPKPGQPPQHDLVFVQEFLMSGDPADVQATYDALESGIRACWGERTVTEDGEKDRTLRLRVPAVGEDRVGTRDIVTEPGPGRRAATWDLRSVLARDGEVLFSIMVAEVTTPKVDPVLDDAAVADIITTIADKLP